MAKNTNEKVKSDTLNPLIALWEKIPAAVRLPVFAVVVIAALIYVKMGNDTVPPEGDSRTALVEESGKKSKAAEIGSFTGVFVEWPEGEIEAYVTNYIQDDQVLVSMSNISPDKKLSSTRSSSSSRTREAKPWTPAPLRWKRNSTPARGPVFSISRPTTWKN